MIKCVAVTNQKGGVGKSTTSNALGAALTLKGYKVLYIDMDAQGNLSYSMNVNNRPITSLEVLTGSANIEDAIIKTDQGDIVPASPSLSGADTLIIGTGKEYRLKEALEAVNDNYDYIVIDTPPSLGTLTINAMTACTDVIIPSQADIYSLQGIGQLALTLQAVKKYCNKDIRIDGILLTRYSSRAILTKDMTELLEDTAATLGTKLYQTKIRECIAIKEAQAFRSDVFKYSKSNAALDYMAFAEEFLKNKE